MASSFDDPFSKLMETPPFFDSWYTWIGIFILAVLAGFRTYLRGPQYFSKISLKDKVALVTGGNRGLGFHTAKELAIRGAKVYIACRNSDLGRTAEARLRSLTGNSSVYYIPLSLGSIEGVRAFSANFKKKEEKLDILYCNAGVMVCPPSKTADGVEYQFGVNYIGHFILVNELLPLLRAAAPSRIVLITSAAYALGIIHYEDVNQSKAEYSNGAECFAQSKLALMLMMNKLNRDLEGTEVTINACHPGVARTDIHRYMPIRTSSFLNVSTFPVCWYLMKTAADGAQTSIFLCVDDTVKETSGKYFVDMQEKAIESPAADEAEADKLWSFTEELIAAADKNRLESSKTLKTEEGCANQQCAGDQSDDITNTNDLAGEEDKYSEQADDDITPDDQSSDGNKVDDETKKSK